MKVCIPSKNRATSIKTHLFFKPKDVLIFVEPQEIQKYKIFWPEYEIVDIKKNEQGLPYVRNFIIDNVFEDKILMCDDDISYIGVRNKHGRYNDLKFNADEFISDIEKTLEENWGYGIPTDSFAFLQNQSTNQQRFFKNTKHMCGMHGLNLKELKTNNIRYDNNQMFFSAEDVDITAQILLNGGDICMDYMYALKHDVRTPGGLDKFRKETHYSLDLSVRAGVEMLSKKYGSEFVRVMRDKDGYCKSFRLDFDLLLKKKDVVLYNIDIYKKTCMI